MSQSTPLDQLDSNGDGPLTAPPADEERVKKILAEMNASDIVQGPPSGPAPLPRVITEPPVSMSTGQLRMDADTARAHLIGNTAPTLADFHSMFQQASPGLAPFHGPAAVQHAVVPQHKPTTSWKSYIMEQARGPVAVAIIVFLLSLPVVTNILSRYASWMYLASGEISVAGLFVKAALAAGMFAAYQGITAALDR